MCKAIGPWKLVTMPAPYSHIRSHVCPSCDEGLKIARRRAGSEPGADGDHAASGGTDGQHSVGRRVWSYLNQPVRLPGAPAGGTPAAVRHTDDAFDTAEAARRIWAYLNQPVRIPVRRPPPQTVNAGGTRPSQDA